MEEDGGVPSEAEAEAEEAAVGEEEEGGLWSRRGAAVSAAPTFLMQETFGRR